MAETINDLYLKYVNGVNDSLEKDRYFKYLYEMVQAGNNTLTQQRQVLHKVVDERWLSTIEEALDALNRIVENPRRSIERNEEVVPVSLARKITADSVRHLGMNTQFIASAEDDDIQPTHVLNVSVDETYNLYENRFIYHLIQRLVTFIDKRTDVIFWSTGDETQNVMRMESKVDDAYEQINYSIEMKIKNLQSPAENDEDNMEVFMRIDRVRRLVMALKNSSFCEIMSGCEKVRSPIQRTNLLTKDRDYRVCYQLWGFLEEYDEVGYSIQVEDSTIQIDEEYLIQMYTNMIGNYAVFKSVTEPDKREMEKLAKTKRRVIRPKIITDVIEEEVTDRNIKDVEIKQVFVEQVTQAQLDAEAKLVEEAKLRKNLEEALVNAEKSASHSMMRVEFALSEQQQAREDANQEKEKRLEAEKRLDTVMSEREEVYLQLQEKENELKEAQLQLTTDAKEYIAQIEAQKNSFNAQMEDLIYKHEHLVKDMEEDFQARLENTELEYFDKMNKREDELNQEYDVLKMKSDDALMTLEENYETQLQSQAQAYEQQLADKDAHYEELLQSQMGTYEQSLEATKADFIDKLAEEKAAYESQMAEQTRSHQVEVHNVRERAASEISQLKAEDAAKIEQITNSADEALANLRQQSERLLDETRQKAADELARVKEDASANMAKAETEYRTAMTQFEETSASKYEKLRTESDAAYKELKETSDAEIKTLKETSKATIENLTEAAKAKEEELTQMVELLKREREILQSANKDLEKQLTETSKAKQKFEIQATQTASKLDAEQKRRTDAESRMEKALEDKMAAEREAAILKAIDQQVKATSVSEFRRAFREEKKLRRKAGK